MRGNCSGTIAILQPHTGLFIGEIENSIEVGNCGEDDIEITTTQLCDVSNVGKEKG